MAHEEPYDSQLTPLPRLLEAIRTGPSPDASAAIEEILARFQPVILAYWKRYRIEGDEYEDFLHDVILRLFGALPGIRDPRAFPGFFRRIVVGTAVDRLRERARSVRSDVAPPDMAERAFDDDITTLLFVQSLLDKLTKYDQKIIQLTFFEDLPSREVAAKLGITPGAVRTAKSRIIKQLHDIVAREESR